MLIRARRYQRANLNVLARYIARHISQNAMRRHHVKIAAVCQRRPARQRKAAYDQNQKRQSPEH